MLKRNPNDFWRLFRTVDKTWIHLITPETKEQSKQWIFRGELAPKDAKATLSTNKVMATIHVDYLEKGKTINGENYANLLNHFNHPIKEKCPHLAKKKILSRPYTCVIAIAKFHELEYELHSHRIYQI